MSSPGRPGVRRRPGRGSAARASPRGRPPAGAWCARAPPPRGRQRGWRWTRPGRRPSGPSGRASRRAVVGVDRRMLVAERVQREVVREELRPVLEQQRHAMPVPVAGGGIALAVAPSIVSDLAVRQLDPVRMIGAPRRRRRAARTRAACAAVAVAMNASNTVFIAPHCSAPPPVCRAVQARNCRNLRGRGSGWTVRTRSVAAGNVGAQSAAGNAHAQSRAASAPVTGPAATLGRGTLDAQSRTSCGTRRGAPRLRRGATKAMGSVGGRFRGPHWRNRRARHSLWTTSRSTGRRWCRRARIIALSPGIVERAGTPCEAWWMATTASGVEEISSRQPATLRR